jgi:alpha-beta hydrolase superfamily lysophospholipase
MHGNDDRITSCQASGEFAEKAKEHCTWIEWQGLFHDMHWEPERQELFEAMRRFIESRIVSEANRAARTE